jgi:hypothetical protein
VALLARGALAEMEAPHTQTTRVVTGALHWLAVGVAVSAVALIDRMQTWLVWPLCAFTATLLYMVVASAQLAVVATRLEIPERRAAAARSGDD